MRRGLGPLCAAAVLLPLAASSQGAPVAAVTPPASVVLQGVPAIPAAYAEGMNRYADYRTAHLAAWHGTRREMLIATRFGNTFQFHRVTAPGGERAQVTFDEGGVAGTGGSARAWFEPGSDHILYLRDISPGKNLLQYFHFDPAVDKSPTMVTDGAGRSIEGVWSRAGRRFAWTSTKRNNADFDLYVMSPHDPASLRMVVELRGFNTVLDWAPDGRTVIVQESLSANQSRLWVINVDDGVKRQVTPDDTEPVAYNVAVIASDGGSAFVVTDRRAEFLQIARLDLQTRALTPLTATTRGDVAELARSADGRWLAFTVNQDAIRTLHLMDAKTGKEKKNLKVPGGDISGLQWHPSGELGFNVQSARVPWDVFSHNPATNVSTRWTTSETGPIKPEDMRENQVVHWPSFDGRQISGVLHRPATRFTGRRPVLVNIHGGPEEQARVLFWGRSNYFLNELGIAIIQPNVRGSTGFGKTFMKLDDGKLREDPLKDLGALFDWIAKQPDLDPQRVWLVGNSYGGYLALMAATKYGDRIRCAIVNSGMSHIVNWLERQPPDTLELRRREYGDERDPEMKKFLNEVSPLTHADRIKTPLFIVHGKNDVRVPVDETAQIVEAVKKNGTPVWYMVFGDEGHQFTRRANVDYVLYGWIAFAKEYLLKDESRVPSP
jgi:dipeptidyl aminopeptidase/acylaminoacyl peptidase